MGFSSKVNFNFLTIEDQQKALTSSYWSYYFALANIPGSDFKALQAKACEDPGYAYMFARDVPGADIKYCQEYACKEPFYAFLFIKDILKSDKEYCFKHAYPEEKYGPDRWKSEYNKYVMQKACE